MTDPSRNMATSALTNTDDTMIAQCTRSSDRKQLVTPAVSQIKTHYYLRPGTRKSYTEFYSDGDSDTDSSFDQPEDDNNLVITISQMTKRRGPDFSAPVTEVSLGPPNNTLPVVPFPVNTFSDLNHLAELCAQKGHMYKDCQKLPILYPVIEEINNMIGRAKTKEGLRKLILFELKVDYRLDMDVRRHIILTGKPGTGKSSVAKMIAKVFHRLGRGHSEEITEGNPLNMISDYEGQTKTEVNNVVQEALSKSGVLLIDEAPALNDNRRNASPDNYGKKAVDMLMQLMDKHRKDLVVILAGYKEDMDRNILQANKGFRRRIQWFFDMEDYTAPELSQIFRQKLQRIGWDLPTQTRFNDQWFSEHYRDFPFFGGSIDNFVQSIITAQIETTFGQNSNTTISDSTLQRGFNDYIRFVVEPLCKEKERYENEQREMSKARTQEINNHIENHTPQTTSFIRGFGLPFMYNSYAKPQAPHVQSVPHVQSDTLSEDLPPMSYD